LLGDVSGKGLPGSLFMAVSRSLYKSTARRRGSAVATMMQEANAEISRDNPDAPFAPTSCRARRAVEPARRGRWHADRRERASASTTANPWRMVRPAGALY
jgi:hypothetical protein